MKKSYMIFLASFLAMPYSEAALSPKSLTGTALTGSFAAADSNYVSLNGGSVIIPSSASTVGLNIRAVTGQSANLQEWRDSGNTLTAKINGNGILSANQIVNLTNSNNAQLNLGVNGATIIRNQSGANPALTITQQDAASTGDILRLRNSAKTLFGLEPGGRAYIGSVYSASSSLVLNRDMTGGVNAQGMYNNGTIQSDVTAAVYGIRSTMNTAASAFTLGVLNNFAAVDGILGSGSAITSNVGFYSANLNNGTTLNAGFRGGVTSGTGKYNLYMDGTAANYLAGSLGIGTTIPDAKLTVNGTIHSKEVKVDLDVPGPDYVFQPDYKLPALAEVKDYINRNRHLPEIPSAKEMAKDGLNLGEMNTRLLKKIEELTLYILEQEQRISKLESQHTSEK